MLRVTMALARPLPPWFCPPSPKYRALRVGFVTFFHVSSIPLVLERLQIAAWLKGEGAKLFKAGDYEKAAEK